MNKEYERWLELYKKDNDGTITDEEHDEMIHLEWDNEEDEVLSMAHWGM